MTDPNSPQDAMSPVTSPASSRAASNGSEQPPAAALAGAPGTTRARESGTAGVGLRRLVHLGPLTRHAHDRLSIFAVRGIFVLAAAGLGLAGGRVLSEITGREELDDPFVSILVACGMAFCIIGVEMLFSRSPIRTLSAITFGLLIGLSLSLVFQYVVEFIVTSVMSWDFRVNHPREQEKLISFLKILSTTIFCYYGVTNLIRTQDDFKFIIPYVEFRKGLKGQAPLVLDTSVFVDGRILGILATGIFDQRMIAPKFVLAELQTIADSADRSLRERGRRGLDILHEIERSYHVELLDHPVSAGQAVDDALVSVAALLDGKLVTTDFNLEKIARLQGIGVININDLATALKPVVVPGEWMTVRLLREGDDKGQAVGFLRDGTMVVVEGARAKIGQEVQIEVTSALQTSAGKMVFGKLRRSPKDSGEA